MRFLSAGRLDHDVVTLPIFALERLWFVGSPGFEHDLQAFFEAVVRLLDGHHEAFELVAAVSLADTSVNPAANTGEADIASVTLRVSGAINAGKAVVKKGEFVLNAAQPSGQSSTGKTVTFTIGDADAGQTGTWKQGDATILDLTAN